MNGWPKGTLVDGVDSDVAELTVLVEDTEIKVTENATVSEILPKFGDSCVRNEERRGDRRVSRVVSRGSGWVAKFWAIAIR